MVDGRAAAQKMIGFGTWRPGYCLEAVWNAYKAVGARATTTAATAYIGWQRSAGKHPGDRNPPAGVPVWWGPKASSSAGDVVISLGGGRVVATDWPRNGVIGITTIDERERQIGRPYLGWTEEILGAKIEYGGVAGGGSANVAGGQRTAGPDGVRRRTQPTSKSPEAGDLLAPGTVGNFTGWVNGESVNGNPVWFQGTSGNWFWSGGFIEGANKSGLKDLNPTTTPPASSTQRTAGPDGVRRRQLPTTASAELQPMLTPGEVGNFNGWTHGQVVNGNDVWFRGISGNWFWSGGFVGGANTAGLPEVSNPGGGTTTPPPAGSVLDPAAPWKNQTPDSELVDAWIGSPNYNNSATGMGAKAKTHIDMHWFGTSATLAGTDAHFQQPGEIRNGRGTQASSQYGIGADGTVHQYVLEKDYAHTNGDYEANATGITIEHEAGPGKPATEATIQKSAELLADIARRHGWGKLVWMVNVFPHNHYIATQCPGDLPTQEIVRRAELLLNPPVEPEEPDEGELLLARAKALLPQLEKFLEDLIAYGEGK